MRRFDLCLLVSGVLTFSAACGSNSPAGGGTGGHGGSNDGGAGTGGGTSGTGGGTSGTGGGTSGTGGGTSGTGGGASGSSGMDGGAGHDGGGSDVDAAVDMPSGDATDGGLTATELRGQYLTNSVLGCAGCHTPQKVGGGGADTTKAFSGVDCFVKGTNICLSSANLTNDATGIKSLTNQQVIDAFTKGLFPDKLDGGTQYLFANMPYYQFSNLTASDAAAIVAYLRSLPAVAHTGTANSGTFATRPTAAQWTPTTLADLPNPDGGPDAGATSLINGKYLGALVCATCHTVNTAAVAPAPLQLDATKAFQGGKEATTSITVPVDGGVDGGDAGADAATTTTISKTIQSANLTPDMTGLKTWTPQQIVTAIKTAKDEGGRALCSPMRALPNITDQDALDIANYLKAIPPKVNTITETCE